MTAYDFVYVYTCGTYKFDINENVLRYVLTFSMSNNLYHRNTLNKIGNAKIKMGYSHMIWV